MRENIKRAILSVIALVTIVITVFTVKDYLRDNEISKEVFEYEIDFPQSASLINPNLKTSNNLDKNKLENSEILNTYFIVKTEMSNKQKENLKDVFLMQKVKPKMEKLDGVTVEKYEREEAQLIIYSDGSYRYKVNVNKDGTKMKNVDFEEGVLVTRAEKFLKDNNLIPGDFAYSKMGTTKVENLDTGEETIITKDLYFAREIDGIEVEGTSKIVISMNGECEVEEIYSSYREIEKEVKVKEHYTVDEMVERLKNFNGTIYINENADVITMDDVEVIYYEDSAPYSENITIQPIYRVRGSSLKNGEEIDEFLGLTSAIKK